ncbi:MAG: Bug family tripartite tricarboxylate transporter substrate binding protein [Dehalococcoidia bacterium]
MTLATVSLCGTALADSGPVRVIVPFPAGGGPDGIARALAPELSRRIGRNVIIENRPGAGGVLGTTVAANAAADGATLILGSSSSLAAAPSLNKKNVRYDAIRDFSHIGMIGRVPVVLIAKANSPLKSIGDLVSAARQKPDSLTFGFPGNGSAPHLLGAVFLHAAGIKVTSVPFRGGADSLTAVMAGNISYAVTNIAPVSAQIRAGAVTPLAVSGRSRTPVLPQVPTFAELGFPSVDMEIWYVLSAPAGTSPALVQQLNGFLNECLELPEVHAQLAKEGMTVFRTSVSDASSFISAELPRWQQAAAVSGVTVE